MGRTSWDQPDNVGTEEMYERPSRIMTAIQMIAAVVAVYAGAVLILSLERMV